VVCGEEVVDYRELAARVERLAARLQADADLVPGTRIAWLGHNAIELLVLLFACARSGLVLVPLNWRLGDGELAAVLEDAGACRVVVDVSCRERLPAMQAWPCWTSGFVVAGLASLSGTGDGAACAPATRRGGPGALLLLVYTSGTTGEPKGVALTQDALLFNALNSLHMHDLGPGDVVLTVLPMFHVGGLNIQTVPALYAGATVVLLPRFEPAATLAALARWRPSLTVQVPATLTALAASPDWPAARLDSLRAITTGSTDVPVPLIESLHRRGVPVIQVYGATETGPLAIYQRIDEARTTVGAIGRAGLHSEVSLRDAEGNAVADGVAGEIWLRGRHVASGYWDRALAAPRPFADGWFRSGDVASRDGQGLYWFKDRIKHVIIAGGENIYPAELERVLAGHPGLREFAVAGRRDARWGEVPVVVAVAAEGGADATTILAAFDARVARYKRPHDVVFVDALPRNALGKVEVARLRALVNGDGSTSAT